MLRWGHWGRTKGCRHHMDRNGFPDNNGTSFSAIFWDAMRTVFTNEDDDPGMITRGEVWTAVENYVSWDPNDTMSPIGFTRDQALKYLYFGDFGSLRPKISGPKVPEHRDAYAAASIPGNRIWFNFYLMINHARRYFPRNSTGVDMLVYWTGAVMLHEIMHCLGFRHGSRESPVPSHPFNRTLPQVAYRGVMDASPYGSSILALTPGSTHIRPCLCASGDSGYSLYSESDDSDESRYSMLPDGPALYSEAAYSNYLHSLEDED